MLAKEIADSDPTLIGLQEAAIWRTGPPDGPPVLGGSAAPNVVFDYIPTLLAELDAIGSPYVLVDKQPEADIEGPTTQGFDIRLTQQDAILAKKSAVDAGELSWSNVIKAQYPHNATFQLSLPLLGGLVSVESTRGYISADVVSNKRSFRFVNTHLEAFHPGVRAAQAQYLTTVGPAAGSGNKVLVGDMNSAPTDSFPNNLAYGALLSGGYTDTWPAANGPGFTSGFNELVNDADTSGLDRRIDQVWEKGSVTTVGAKVTGTDPDNRTPGGLWPSDHAGLVTTLQP